MKQTLAISLFIFTFVLNSCIKDEPLNREADITDIKVPGNTFISSVISETNQQIQIFVTNEADITSIAPEITVTPGATIVPASGVALNFTTPQVYTVTSQDGNYTKQYTVSVSSDLSLEYEFEEWEQGTVNNHLYPIPSSDNNVWSTGNSGVAIVTDANPYPTDKTTDAYSGTYAAKMQTIKGIEIQSLGLKIPIFAGSLFLGDFKANLASPLLSLQLGRMYWQANGKPITFSGYYKYTPGPVYTDNNGNPVSGKTDMYSIYAVIFKVSKDDSGQSEYLDGSTISTSDKIIARADWKQQNAADTDTPVDKGFTKFVIPFTYTEDFDFDAYNYKMTIVMSSSENGNLYEGAVGSTLIVDDLKITTEDF
jgi:hypothetical protein